MLSFAGGGILLTLICNSPSLRELRKEAQSRNLEVGIDTEAMEEWLMVLIPMACTVCFLIAPRTTSSGVALFIVSQASHLNHWSRKCPRDLTIDQAYGGGGFSRLNNPSQMTLTCVKLT